MIQTCLGTRLNFPVSQTLIAFCGTQYIYQYTNSYHGLQEFEKFQSLLPCGSILCFEYSNMIDLYAQGWDSAFNYIGTRILKFWELFQEKIGLGLLDSFQKILLEFLEIHIDSFKVSRGSQQLWVHLLSWFKKSLYAMMIREQAYFICMSLRFYCVEFLACVYRS